MTRSNLDTTELGTDAIDASRRALLDAVGPAPEMTLIRPYGNLGDELIWAGTRELLRGHVYREIGIDQLASASGELAVLMGGGAWSRRYNEFMPEALAIAEHRFDRVIVFPSTFEVSEDRVRAALERSHAIFFARELESFGQIRGLCRAQLAHDCAFFADFSEFDAPGTGELNAFRSDDESLGLVELPADNEDISDTAESLDAWLRTIEGHAVINTDRAHVMIAGALMGKQVNYSPSSYFKVGAIAEFALSEYDVRPLESLNGEVTKPIAASTPLGVAHEDAPSRVTVGVLSRDHASEVTSTIDSVLEQSGDIRVLVLDRNSRPQTRAALEAVAARAPEVELKLSDRDSGAAASLRLAVELAESEYVMFLDDQLRLSIGALARLVATLDENPDVAAVSSRGGWLEIDRSTVIINETREGAAGPTGWVPSLGTLFRRSVLADVPFAGGLDLDAQNADWCLRVEQFAPGSLRRCPEATVIVPKPSDQPRGTSFVERASATRALPSHFEFFARHDRLLEAPLLELVPELGDPDGRINPPAAMLLLGLVAERGPEWTLMEWMNGNLGPRIEWRPRDGEPELSEAQRERLEWLEARNERLTGIENGGWWKLREKVSPAIRLVRR